MSVPPLTPDAPRIYTLMTPDEKREASQAMLPILSPREQSELAPIAVPAEALPEVKFGLDQCFYCGRFGHWLRSCPDKLAFLPSDAAPRNHWRLLQNGRYYDITVIWPSILDNELGQPFRNPMWWDMVHDTHNAYKEGDETAEVFSGSETAPAKMEFQGMTCFKNLDIDKVAEGTSYWLLDEPLVKKTTSNLFASESPTYKIGKHHDVESRADCGAYQ